MAVAPEPAKPEVAPPAAKPVEPAKPLQVNNVGTLIHKRFRGSMAGLYYGPWFCLLHGTGRHACCGPDANRSAGARCRQSSGPGLDRLSAFAPAIRSPLTKIITILAEGGEELVIVC